MALPVSFEETHLLNKEPEQQPALVSSWGRHSKLASVGLLLLVGLASVATLFSGRVEPDRSKEVSFDPERIIVEAEPDLSCTSLTAAPKDYVPWKIGDPYDKNVDTEVQWPPQTCWRDSYKKEKNDRRRKKSDGSACDSDYVSVGKKTCRAVCPEGWLTCGIREDRGLMCGQSRQDCAESKFQMVKSVTEVLVNTAALAVPGSKAAQLAVKALQLMKDVMDFIGEVVAFRKGTAWEKAKAVIAKLPGGEDFLGLIEELICYSKLLKTLKDSDPPVDTDDTYKIRRRLLTIVGKWIAQELIEVIDAAPLGVTAVIKAFKKPKCHDPDYSWFVTEEVPAKAPAGYNITSDVSIDPKAEGCDDTDSDLEPSTCGEKDKDQVLIDACTSACNANPLCVGFQFKDGSKGGQLKNGLALACYQKDKKWQWYEKYSGEK